MDSEFSFAATVCVINVIASRVCVRVSCVCVRASGRGGGAALLLPVRSDVGEQLPPQRGCNGALRQRKRSGPMAGMRVTAAAPRVRRMGPRAPAGQDYEQERCNSASTP